jgi:hypothetical protein
MLIDTLLPKGSLTIISGKAYSGKTFMAMELAKSVAYNMKAFNKFRPQPGKGTNVLFFQLDSPKYDTGRAFICMIRDSIPSLEFDPRWYSNEIDACKWVWHQRVNLTRTIDLQKIIHTANAATYSKGFSEEGDETLITGTSLIIFDTFRRIHPSDENSSTEMQPVMDAIDYIRAQTSAAVILLHHTSKNQEYGPTIRGNTAIEGSADNIFYVKGNKKTGICTVTVDKCRGVLIPDFKYQIATVTDDDGYTYKTVNYVEPEHEEAITNQTRTNIMSHITLTGSASRKSLKQKFNTIHPATIDTHLKALCDKGLLEKRRTGRIVEYFPLDKPSKDATIKSSDGDKLKGDLHNTSQG